MVGEEPDRSPGLAWRTTAPSTKPDQHLGCSHILLLQDSPVCLRVNPTPRTRPAVTYVAEPRPACLHAPWHACLPPAVSTRQTPRRAVRPQHPPPARISICLEVRVLLVPFSPCLLRERVPLGSGSFLVTAVFLLPRTQLVLSTNSSECGGLAAAASGHREPYHCDGSGAAQGTGRAVAPGAAWPESTRGTSLTPEYN